MNLSLETSASLIHQQQQIHDRVRPAQESHLQAEYGHPDIWAELQSGTDSSIGAYMCRDIQVPVRSVGVSRCAWWSLESHPAGQLESVYFRIYWPQGLALHRLQ